jgi:hypothetical protein
VESAKKALVAAVPSARTPGRPLAEGLLEFEELLRGAQAEMDAWRHPALHTEWTGCDRGIAEALRRAEALRLRAPDLGFEPMLAAISDLIAPLEPFEPAAEGFRALGSRLR